MKFHVSLSNLLKSVCLLYTVIVVCKSEAITAAEKESLDTWSIDGKVDVVSTSDKDWIGHTKILIDGGDYVGYLRSDGSFGVNGLPSGTYVVEVASPAYIFEALRVDITSKGRHRARKVSFLQPSNIKTMTYPLEFRERRKASYFQVREQWKITDFLFNPMVLTMVLPLLLIMVLPKMMNAADPEAQKDMQTQMKALNDKSSMPDMSEMLAGWFGGSTKNTKSKSQKRR